MNIGEAYVSGVIAAVVILLLCGVWITLYLLPRALGQYACGAVNLNQPLRASLLEKLHRSRTAWDHSVKRFRVLHWICLIGVIVVPTCLASLGKYMPAMTKDVLSVVVAIFGSVQAIVKPADKFLRDIEFRDEADYLMRQAMATENEAQLTVLMRRFERVERRFHTGQHPWPTAKSESGQLAWNESSAASALGQGQH